MRMLGQRNAPFALHRQGVTMLGRNRHPAFRIKIKCGRALKHPENPPAYILPNRPYRELSLCQEACKFPHKKTLFHTVAHFSGSIICGQGIFRMQKTIFPNEVNDLAKILEEEHSSISPIN